MLDYRDLYKNLEIYEKAFQNRSHDFDAAGFKRLVEDKLDVQQEVESKREQMNRESKKFKRQKITPEAAENLRSLKSDIKDLETKLSELSNALDLELLVTPNIPTDRAPIGSNSEDNSEVNRWGNIPFFEFDTRDHFDIGNQLGIFDFNMAAKVTGARFAVVKGKGAILEQALKSFFIAEALKNGYELVSVPFIVNRDTITGTGQLPKFEFDMFSLSLNEGTYYLIPTAEVPVTGLHANEIIPADALPLKYCSLTPCFRKEAGSAGRDTKGLIRLHQFEKLELVKYASPEHSWDELESLTADAEGILKKLQIPHRRMALCTGDLGFASAFTYDIEVWMPGQSQYREVSSCSLYTDYQARRLKTRYRQSEKQTALVHTINGSGLPIGRTLAAIIENYQQADGSLLIPEVLQQYTGFEKIEPLD
jgi:seryl-tRNA synthetase